MGCLSTFADVAKLEPAAPRRLAVLNPFTVKALVKSDDQPLIAQHYPVIEDLITLRRNQASRIPRDEHNATICDIRTMIKPHWIKTRKVQRQPSVEAEFQWIYRDAAK